MTKGYIMTNEHKAEELKGRAEEAVGAMTDDPDMKREGKMDQAAAKVKRGADKAAEKIGDAIDSARGKK